MLAKLLEQDHGQKAGPCPATGDDVEWRRRLADLLAITASELLADVLDHLPGFGDDLQRLGDVLAQLAQPPTAAAAHRRSRCKPSAPARLPVRAADGRGRVCAKAACE